MWDLLFCIEPIASAVWGTAGILDKDKQIRRCFGRACSIGLSKYCIKVGKNSRSTVSRVKVAKCIKGLLNYAPNHYILTQINILKLIILFYTGFFRRWQSFATEYNPCLQPGRWSPLSAASVSKGFIRAYTSPKAVSYSVNMSLSFINLVG